eukprot:scaffold1008_cov47-Attheya_sp.AAC.3
MVERSNIVWVLVISAVVVIPVVTTEVNAFGLNLNRRSSQTPHRRRVSYNAPTSPFSVTSLRSLAEKKEERLSDSASTFEESSALPSPKSQSTSPQSIPEMQTHLFYANDIPVTNEAVTDAKNTGGDILGNDIANKLSKPWVEVVLGGLVLLSSFLVAISTLPQLPPDSVKLVNHLEDGIAWAFAMEFMARLINLRLLRILRLQRVLVDMETFASFEIALGLQPTDVRPYQLQLARVVLSVFTLLSVSTGLIYTAEHTANPTMFPDYFTALYFGLTTLTTVGFGDITPITWEGRLVVSGSILAGVAIIPAQAAALVEALLEYQNEKTAGTVVATNASGNNDRERSNDEGNVKIVGQIPTIGRRRPFVGHVGLDNLFPFRVKANASI